jgi:penicillin-binding protein 1A
MFASLAKFFKFLAVMTVVFLILGILATSYILFYYSKGLPDYHQLHSYNPSIVTRFYAADGKLLEEYAKEHRLFIPISAIPKQLINAFLAAEDKNFYHHKGIDVSSLVRAVVQNIVNLGQNRSLVGGSTITQQVVKNFLLTNEKSLSRKIKEAILSFRISQIYSKDRILELYLNQIYLGAGSYGVASASLNYFNKSIDELTLEEAAFLAALPKAPSTYDPKRNYEKAKVRRDWVLERIFEEGYITETQLKEAILKPIALRIRDRDSVAKGDFFAEAVRRNIADIYGETVLYEGGLVVRTTLDPRLQDIAERAFRKGLISYDQRRGYRGPLKHLDNITNWQTELTVVQKPKAIGTWQLAVVLAAGQEKAIIGLEDGSKALLPLSDLAWTKSNIDAVSDVLKKGDVILVEEIKANKNISYSLRQIPEVSGGLIAMDPHTGKVLALVGGYYYGDSQFNRAIQAKRQPGSAFKAFVYLAALENGFTPTSIILDGPVELSQGPGLPAWRPKNYSGDFLGPTTLRRGVEKSRNTMTVRLAQMLGIKKILEVTTRFGINKNPQRNFSIVLGAAETTLLDLTNAYSIVVNGGKKINPSLIERIQDRNGSTIFKRDNSICEHCVVESLTEVSNVIVPEIKDQKEVIVDPRTSYQMVSLLEGVIQRGTGGAAKKLNYTLGGKTGTSNDSKDVWFIGFSPNLVVGTYVGYDNPKTLGRRETGASVALPIFIDFMEEALKGKPDIPFNIPAGIKMVKINAETGVPVDPATPLDKNIIFEAFKTGTEPSQREVNSIETIMPSNPNVTNPQGTTDESEEETLDGGIGSFY